MQPTGCALLYATIRLRFVGNDGRDARARARGALPEEVWSAITEPEQLVQWFANDVELDSRPGGRAAFRWDNGEERTAVVDQVWTRSASSACVNCDGGTVVL